MRLKEMASRKGAADRTPTLLQRQQARGAAPRIRDIRPTSQGSVIRVRTRQL